MMPWPSWTPCRRSTRSSVRCCCRCRHRGELEAFDTLTRFLPSLPSGFRYALEVRHRSWLAKDTLPRLLGLLQKHAVALCLVQHAWMPALDEVTAPFVYIRWLGRREDIPDDDFSHVRINRDAQLDSWSEQIKSYLRAGLTVYGYFNNHYQGHCAGIRPGDADAAGGRGWTGLKRGTGSQPLAPQAQRAPLYCGDSSRLLRRSRGGPRPSCNPAVPGGAPPGSSCHDIARTGAVRSGGYSDHDEPTGIRWAVCLRDHLQADWDS